MTKFLIKLSSIHEQSGKTVYRVSKDTGMNYNTVKKYTSGWIEADYLSPEVVQLASYFGVSWRDPHVVETINDDGTDTRPVPAVNGGTA